MRPTVPRVFRGQPTWVLPALALLLMIAAVLYSYNIGYSGLSTYYASAAKSMSESWSALFTGAMNPSATMTLDKLSGFLVPQALAIRLFGFHAWALSLPQVFEGLVTIVASYAIGARWRGPAIGIATAAVMTVTPMLAAMFGHAMEDGMLTMTMVLAFAAWQRSVLSGRMGWLLLAGFWVAVGFQAKMMQAWLILPALLLGTLIAAPGPLRRRIGRVLIAGAVTGLLSISWMSAIQLTPAQNRPYVDGTTNDNMFSMVFGYNGVDRLIPGAIPGAVPQLGPGSGQSVTSGTRTADAGHSKIKLVLPEITSQIGWLYPVAAAGAGVELLAVGLARRRRRSAAAADAPDAAPTPATTTTTTTTTTVADRADGAPSRLDLAMTWSLLAWLGVTAVVLSAAFVPHATYFGVIALPLALFAVIGAATAIRWYRERAAGWRGIALPVLVAVQTVWQLLIIVNGAVTLFWLAPIIGVVGLVAVVLLVRGRTVARGRRAAVAIAVAASLIAPVVWSSFVLGPGGSGSAGDAYAGPRMEVVGNVFHARHPARAKSTIVPVSSVTPIAPAVRHHVVLIRHPFAVPHDPQLNAEQVRLVDYVVARNGGRRVLFATDTLAVAVSVILYTHDDAQPMGGFSRQAPTTDAAAVSREIAQHRLRFVLLAHAAPSATNTAIVGVRSWVQHHCTATIHGRFRDGSSTDLTLWDCGVTH